MYINFVYNQSVVKELDSDIKNTSLSTNETIVLDGLNNGLCYELDISGGKVNFIELVTFGEEWDGIITEKFIFK